MSWKEWQYHFSVYFKAYLVGRSVIDFWSFHAYSTKRIINHRSVIFKSIVVHPFRSDGRRWNGFIGVYLALIDCELWNGRKLLFEERQECKIKSKQNSILLDVVIWNTKNLNLPLTVLLPIWNWWKDVQKQKSVITDWLPEIAATSINDAYFKNIRLCQFVISPALFCSQCCHGLKVAGQTLKLPIKLWNSREVTFSADLFLNMAL